MADLPERFGKYHVLGLIARGGMAEVYKVKTVGIAGFEKIQALKRIAPDFAREPRFIRSFVDEARIAVELNHRNIVQVFDFGRADGELYLAMELIEGVDLRTAMTDAGEADRRLPVPLACHVVGEVAAGLDYAHRKADGRGRSLGIVHCDVSPQNIMLSYEGFVKILDFGVARARIAAGPDKRRLRGKPRYMAPEQTRGDAPTAATDVFALGILAWELLTGLPLFDGADLPAILAAVRRADVPPVERLNPDVPVYLSAAISRALAAQPEERGTAADLGAALTGAARTLTTGVSARTLAHWLGQVYPRPQHIEPERTETTAVQVPPVTARQPTAPTVGDGPAALAPAAATPEDIDRELDERLGELRTLLEKRRVVAVAALVEGAAAEARRELVRTLADLAYKRGAVIQASDDDGAVVVFGLEVAGEDDVANAMGYALDAIEVAADAARRVDQRLALRIAARAGIVSRRREGGAVQLVGGAVEEARALARDAEPARVLLSGGAGRLTSAHYVFRELPARRLHRRRLRVLELLGRRNFDERARALRERRGRFFGRAHELQLLEAAMARAAREQRRVAVVILGRAGVGKSRLVAEFVARTSAVADPILVAVAGTPGGRAAPFAMVTDLFQASLNLPPGRGEAARAILARRLRHVLTQADLDPEDVDEVVTSLDLATELRDGAPLTAAEPEATGDLRDRITASLGRFRAAFAGDGRPLITVLEDYHFADGASADVLRRSLRQPADGAELLVVTALPEVDLARDELELLLELEDLAGEDRAALIGDRLANAASPEAVAAVAERAGGNPLFIEEVAAAVREAGPQRVPASVRDIIVARVDGLPASTKRVLQYAAVAGRVFRARILEELGGLDVQRELHQLCDEALLRPADQASLDVGEGELSFAHGLIREVVYESLSEPARRQAHANLGKLLASRARAGRDEPPATIAYHLELGGEPAAAAAYWLRAGRLALAAFDAPAAVAACSRALALDEAPASAAARARRREALAAREQAHRMLGDHDAQGHDLELLMALTEDDPQRLADVENRVAARLLRLGDYAAAIEATHAAERAAQTAGDARARGEALRLRAESSERQGRFEDALACLSQALAIFRALGGGPDETRALIGMGRIHLVRARYEAAQAVYEPMLEGLRDEVDPWLERIVRNHMAVVHMCLGDFEAAMTSARRSVDICRRYGDRAREGDNLSVCGIISMEVGWHGDARHYFEQALGILDSTGSRWSRADCLVYAGANEILLGELTAGFAHLDEAVALARTLGARYIEANALVARAGALLHRDGPGDREAAVDDAAAAVRTARDSTLVGPEIQGLSRQAAACWRAGRLAEALALSRRAIELLDEQRYVEGSEEEILYVHYQLLSAAGIPGSDEILARARAGLERKLAAMTRADWQDAFRRIPLHAAILDHH